MRGEAAAVFLTDVYMDVVVLALCQLANLQSYSQHAHQEWEVISFFISLKNSYSWRGVSRQVD